MAQADQKRPSRILVVAALLLVAGAGWGGYGLFVRPLLYSPFQYAAVNQEIINSDGKPIPAKPLVTHLSIPSAVRAIYMTSWVAGTSRIRERLIKLIDETELNAVVIDIKDYSGRIAFAVDDPELIATGAVEVRIPDIRTLIADLHQRGIYVIGRISVFQDSYFVNRHPELAVHRRSDPSERFIRVDSKVWKDRKGISWLEAGVTPVWDYVVRIARAARAVGFDEINFDYIRFPSDGDMRDIGYQHFDPANETRAEVLKRFYAYLSRELAPLGMPISVDLFGLTTTSFDDLGIGQVLVDAAPYFDYIAPMVYPSHFASGFLNFSNPAAHPYEVVKHSLSSAVERLTALASTTATSTTPSIKDTQPSVLPVRRGELRPWLQDFDLGANYTAAMVRAQIQATYDAGLTSWMLWDPNNRYTREALDK